VALGVFETGEIGEVYVHPRLMGRAGSAGLHPQGGNCGGNGRFCKIVTERNGVMSCLAIMNAPLPPRWGGVEESSHTQATGYTRQLDPRLHETK
jgi:hypothetical protein